MNKILSIERDYRAVAQRLHRNSPRVGESGYGPLYSLMLQRLFVLAAVLLLVQVLTGLNAINYLMPVALIMMAGIYFYLKKIKALDAYVDNPAYFEQESTPLGQFIGTLILAIIISIGCMYILRHYFREHSLLYYVFTAGVDKIRYLP